LGRRKDEKGRGEWRVISGELRKAAFQIQDSKFKRTEGRKQKAVGGRQNV